MRGSIGLELKEFRIAFCKSHNPIWVMGIAGSQGPPGGVLEVIIGFRAPEFGGLGSGPAFAIPETLNPKPYMNDAQLLRGTRRV